MKKYYFQNKKRNLFIGKIICLARTYKKHAEEMHSPLSPNPIIFLKPASAVIHSGDFIRYPSQSTCLHHEVEVGLVIGKKAYNISKESSLDIVDGYLVGIDVTARDIQMIAKKNGWPWTIAKGFDTFAPISNVVSKDVIENPNNLDFQLTVNSKVCQKGNTSNLLWDVETLISYISSIMTLEPGDLILTGTPEGVNELGIGDQITAELGKHISLFVDVK
jgi:5-carboxymethyl-2-hydroxymuconate isomerase